jgi:predicted alpha/beta hydrolase
VFATTSDGVRLALTRFPAAGSGRGVVLLTHAMMARSSYLTRAATLLAARGHECFTLDFRGHGASVPPSARTAGWRFEDYVERDLPAAVEAIARATGAAPDHVGHSLGGLVTAAAIASRTIAPPARLVLVAASPWIRVGLARRALIELLTATARPLGYLPVRALRGGTDDEPHVYLRQLRGWVRAGTWPYLEALRGARVPTLCVIGERDAICRAEDARVLGERLGATLRHISRARHFDFFRDPALEDFVQLLTDFLGPVGAS